MTQIKTPDNVLDRLTGLLAGPATRSAAGLSPHVTRKFVADGLIVPTNKFHKSLDEDGNPKAGRPAPIYKLVPAVRKRVQRHVAKQGVSEATAAPVAA